MTNYQKGVDLWGHVKYKHKRVWPKGSIFRGEPRELLDKTRKLIKEN